MDSVPNTSHNGPKINSELSSKSVSVAGLQEEDLLNCSKEKFGLTFRDFIPNYCGKSSKSDYPFETFSVLIDRANQWLVCNLQVKVCMCETIKLNCQSSKQIDNNEVKYYQVLYSEDRIVQGLRLWLVPRRESILPQKIGYVNVVPTHFDSEQNPYGTLNHTVDHMNRLFSSHSFQGQIINVQTVKLRIDRYEKVVIDPDEFFWSREHYRGSSFLFILRAFYEIGGDTYKRIDIFDVVPRYISGLNVKAVYEDFMTLLSKVHNWCKEQPFPILNIQTINIMVDGAPDKINSQKMFFQVRDKEYTTNYVRIARVVVAVPHNFDFHKSTANVFLACKDFIPVQVTNESLFGVPDFENIQQTRIRLQQWMEVTGAKVICAETVHSMMYGVGKGMIAANNSHTCIYRKDRVLWIQFFRVYLNGVYQNPPEEALPPLPTLPNDDCVLS